MRLLANPRDRLHLSLLLRGWGAQTEADVQERLAERPELVKYLNQHAGNHKQKAVIEAIIE